MAQSLLIIRWYLILQVICLVSLPLAFVIFRGLPDRGYPFSKALSIFLITYINWFAVSFGLFSYSTLSLVGCALVILILSVVLLVRLKEELVAAIRANLKIIVIYEILFLLVFLIFVTIRGHDPNIYGTEKFMDFSFITGIARNTSFPPNDQWAAGVTVNYYYFGYLIITNLVKLTAVPPEYGYNLALATLAALTFVSISSIAYNLSKRISVAIAAGVFMVFMGNLDGFREFLASDTIGNFNWWNPSRVIGRGDTINEFPFFTFLHADLHPHIIALPFFMLMIASVMNILFHGKKISWLYFAYLAVLIGGLWIMNPWDLPLSILLLWSVLLIHVVKNKPELPRAALYLVAPIIIVVLDRFLLYVPFHGSFESFSKGFGAKLAVTSLGQMLLMWGFFFFVLLTFLIMNVVRARVAISGEKLWAFGLGAVFLVAAGSLYFPNLVIFVTAAGLALAIANLLLFIREREMTFVILLIAISFAIFFGCELFYVKDTYGERLYRMNTLFKFYFQAWTLVSIAAACTLPLIFEGLRAKGARRTWVVAFAALAVASLCYPVLAINVRCGGFMKRFDLNGISYMARDHPGDYEAVMWLKENVRGAPVILEATKDPYAYYSRISSNTGLPTVLGWGNHEGLWRSTHELPQERKRDVEEIYNTTDTNRAAELLRKYGVRFVYVGELERELYKPSGLRKFSSFMRPAWSGRDSVVYEFVDPNLRMLFEGPVR